MKKWKQCLTALLVGVMTFAGGAAALTSGKTAEAAGETVSVNENTVWSYLDDNTKPADGWMSESFSTENWKRSAEEVGALMQLFRFYAKRLLAMAEKNNIRVRMIGERSRFAPDIVGAINVLEEKTKKNTGMTFVIAVNYGSRDEITRAVRKIMTDVEKGKIAPEDMTEKVFASYLDTAGIPDPDLMIRTSGELRLSNYLLWQLAYSELYVTECLWPDFNKEELLNAIRQYDKRERRFGGVTAVKTE